MDENLKREIWAFVDEHRARALWWMRADYYPQNTEQARDVLKSIATRGDREMFICAMTLRRRLGN